MGWGEFSYATKRRQRGRDVLQGEEMIQGHRIGFSGYRVVSEQRLDLGRKQKAIAAEIIKEGFLADAITCQE